MRKKATVTILTIDTETGDITSDDIGETPQAGWVVSFADYSSCTDEQKRWGFVFTAGMAQSSLIIP